MYYFLMGKCNTSANKKPEHDAASIISKSLQNKYGVNNILKKNTAFSSAKKFF